MTLKDVCVQILYQKGKASNMNLVNYLLTVLLSLEPSHSDKETWEERSERMNIVAQAIDDASSRATCQDEYNVEGCKKTWPSSKKSLALLLVTNGYWESGFAKNVHEGNCRPNECDAHTVDGTVYHRARSPWQIQKTALVTSEEYQKMNSSTLESTKISAYAAARHLSIGMNSCKTIIGAMSIYGGIRSCKWSGVASRAEFYKKLEQKTDEQLEKSVEMRKKRLEDRLTQATKK